jgi:hypothetical protein
MDKENIRFKDSVPELYLLDIMREFRSFQQTGRWHVQCERNSSYVQGREGEVIYPIMLLDGTELEYRGMEILRQAWPCKLTSQFLLKIVIPEARHEWEHNKLWFGLEEFCCKHIHLSSVEKHAINPFYATMIEGEIVSNNEPRPTYTLREILSNNALRPEYTIPIKRGG